MSCAPPRARPDRRLCVAPMMDRTDRHCRYFHRLLTRRALLYTEMVTTKAVLRGDRDRFLAYDPAELPLALQLGGDDPGELATAARIAESRGFSEVNLNVGCPSHRVQKGRFGACLMRQPEVVAEAVATMRAVVSLPVTVKHRLGVDELDRYEDLAGFVDRVAAGGCRTFVVHARKAWLQGLSPKQNREIPPLRYEEVYRLKAERPELEVILNGGVANLDEAAQHLRHVDGVMLGRAAYQRPYLLAEADRRIFGEPDALPPPRAEILSRLEPYLRRELEQGTPLTAVARHLLGLYHGCRGARAWRRHLSEGARGEDAGVALLHAAARRADESSAPSPAGRPLSTFRPDPDTISTLSS